MRLVEWVVYGVGTYRNRVQSRRTLLEMRLARPLRLMQNIRYVSQEEQLAKADPFSHLALTLPAAAWMDSSKIRELVARLT